VISETLYSILSGAAGVTAITTGIFPSVVPQKATFPAVVYGKDSTRFQESFDGHNLLIATLFQIDCYGKTSAEAESLADAVKNALIDYRTSPVNRTRIDNEITLFEPDTELHRVLLQFTIWHVTT